MALNSSGPLSVGGPIVGQSINLELKLSPTAMSSLNQSDFRGLAQVPTGQISISKFWGKSSFVSRAIGQMGLIPVGQASSSTASSQSNVWYCNIETNGSQTYFGTFVSGITISSGGIASSTRAITVGGVISTKVYSQNAHYTTFGTSGSWSTFGAIPNDSGKTGIFATIAASNKIYGIKCGGRGITNIGSNPSNLTTGARCTIATLGNFESWGTLLYGQGSMGAVSTNQTRFVRIGGETTQGVTTFCTYTGIVSGAVWASFGTLNDSLNKDFTTSIWSNTRGIVAGGKATVGSARVAIANIQYWTTATLGNTAGFGSLTAARYEAASCCSNLYGIVLAGRMSGVGSKNTVDFVINKSDKITIATIGNSPSWGSLAGGADSIGSTNMCSNNNGGQV